MTDHDTPALSDTGIDTIDDLQQLVMWAATLIANVDDGDWSGQPEVWSDGAFEWTSAYHRFLISQDDGLT